VEREGLEPCTICLEHYEDGDMICWSHNRHCNHVFHQECIVEWLGLHNECPVCRQDFLSLEDLDDETEHAEHSESEEQPPAEETEDSPVDEVPRVPWISTLFQRQRIVQPIHPVEMEQAQANGASIHQWPSSHYEESSVPIEDLESVDEGEGAGANESIESRATSLNATDVAAV
jgi:Ring finger domain